MSARYLFLLSYFVLVTSSSVYITCPPITTPNWKSLCSPSLIKSPSAAWANYYEEINTTGWSRLYVHSNSSFDDEIQAYAAGFAEGYLTPYRTFQTYANYKAAFYNDTIIKTLTPFIIENEQWIKKQILENSPKDPYWRQVDLIYNQMDGIVDGHNEACKKLNQTTWALTRMDILLVNMYYDSSDILSSLVPNERPRNNMSKSEAIDWTLRHTHCSVIVRLTANMSELFTAHTTWTNYYVMLRVFKVYDLPLNGVRARQSQFSGFFGMLASGDDYYQLSSGLVVTETTNSVYNASLYDFVKPNTVLYWVRTLAANRLASSGQEWVNICGKYNSGTYNNQWIVIDYNKFTPGQDLKPGTLWIAEQLPGHWEIADVTNVLQYGWWQSYNIPSIPSIFKISGCQNMEDLHGSYFSYQRCARATIFRRDAGSLEDLEGIKHFIHHNDWTHDPLSLNSPANQIAARVDLQPPNTSIKRRAMGAIDAKVTSYLLSKQMLTHAVSSPPYDNVPFFSWSQHDGEWQNVPHLGQPDDWHFEWEIMSTLE